MINGSACARTCLSEKGEQAGAQKNEQKNRTIKKTERRRPHSSGRRSYGSDFGSASLIADVRSKDGRSDLVSGELRDSAEAFHQLLIGGDGVGHGAVVELLVGHHVKVAGAGQPEEDGLLLAGLFAL